MPTKDRAICLWTTDYSETSQVLTMLTRTEGVVRLIAKGAKRSKSKSGGRIDLFSEGELVFGGGKKEALGTLFEFVEDTNHAAVRRGLDRLNVALYVLELNSALLAEGDPHPEVFDLTHSVLVRLGQPDASPPAVLAWFQYRLLKRVGLLAEVGACAACGGAVGGGAAFSSQAGGLLCRDCQAGATEKIAASPTAVAGLAALAAAEKGKRPALPEPQARAANALLAYHIEYQLGKRLKTARHALGR